MQGLWLSMGRIDEVWMFRAEVSGELVQSVVSNKDTGRNVQHAVFGIEVLNGGAAAGRVTFAKDFLKVPVQKLNNSITHGSVANLRRSTHTFSVTQSGVEVVQDPELSKDDRPLWVAVEAFDLAAFEFEHVAARCVHLLTRGRQLAKGKLQRAIVGALQSQLHHDDNVRLSG
jgi:hypothetical protein